MSEQKIHWNDFKKSFFAAAEEGAYILSRTLRHVPLLRLVLRLNPIQSDGAAAIFHTLQVMPIKELDLGTCGISETITKLFMMLICQHNTLLYIDISNNSLGEVRNTQFSLNNFFNQIISGLW